MGNISPEQQKQLDLKFDRDFAKFDKDKDGYLDETELRNFVIEMIDDNYSYPNPEERQKEIDAAYTKMMTKYIKNGDKKISKDDFKKLCKK